MDNKDEKYNADEIIEVADSDISDATAEDINEYLDPMSVFDELDITRKTASLWQYKPVPEDEPEPFEEYYFSEEDFEGGKITAARVRGKKHKHDGTNCDDWFEYDVSGNWRIMIVSDGAGSKKFSRIGARDACRAGVSYLKEKLTEAPEEITSNLSLDFADGKFTESCSYFASVLQDAVISAKDSVEKAFEERKSKYDYLSILGRDLELKDFSCTFLACIVLPVVTENHTEYFAVSVQIGDGIICSVDRSESADRALRLLSTPDSGTYGGETDFITSESQTRKESLMGRTRIMRGRSSAFMLMTDGVADDYFPNSPELLRLYLDLGLNCITAVSGEGSEGDIPEKIPEPKKHIWVNDNEKTFSVQYARVLAEKTGNDTKTLWNNTALVNAAALDKFDCELSEKRSERLSVWLDNYTERGSFDDRTLVICEMNRESDSNDG